MHYDAAARHLLNVLLKWGQTPLPQSVLCGNKAFAVGDVEQSQQPESAYICIHLHTSAYSTRIKTSQHQTTTLDVNLALHGTVLHRTVRDLDDFSSNVQQFGPTTMD